MIRQFLETDLDDIISLWEICDLTRPWNSLDIDILRKVAHKDGLFLVAIKDNQLIATLMGGYDGHRGWLNYLAVNPMFSAMALLQRSYNS